jgi:acetyltransferase
MPIRNLDKLFYPRSVAVVGASNRDGAPGHAVMHNLLHGGFEGPIMPVSPDDRAISGVLAYPRIEALPETPDLAVVCGTAAAVPDALRALGERGTRAAILLAERTGGKSAGNGHGILAEAGRYGMRVLGPHCLGIMVPGIGLNASIAPVAAQPGGVAFVSQSSTVCATVLDWAHDRDIGFSHFVSLGDTVDIDLADVIDYLGNDAMTRAILVYIESINHGRQFMSAGRGASRNKPVLVIKSGRTAEGLRAAARDLDPATDDIYDAAIRRAGMLRVHGFSELFAAVETLGRSRPLKGERLAIISNGVGIAVMAVDNLMLSGGRLAGLSEATLTALGKVAAHDGLPGNPVHLLWDAPPESYAASARAVFADRSVDAVLLLHAPTAAVSSTRIAEAVTAVVKETRGALLASFMGGHSVAEARRRFVDARIPTFDTANQAVEAFMHMVRYRRSQEILMQTPPSKPAEFNVTREDVRVMITEMLRRGQTILAGREAKSLLAAYGMASVEVRMTEAAEASATTAGGGPALGARVLVQGFGIERILRKPSTRELRITVADDPVFGPVILFGHGGPAADIVADRAVGLPPLNMSLAKELIERTRVYKLLQGYGDVPPADVAAVCILLMQVSQMVIDVPEIAALDINPVCADERGVFVVDAQILIAPATLAAEQRLAIRPYPKELEESFTLASGRTVLLRPIRPEDEPAHHDFVGRCTPEDMRLRFFHLVRSLPHSEMARLTQIDYDREMAFIATAPRADGQGPETLGVVRTVADLNNDRAEYAILVRSDMKGQHLGWKLMHKIIEYNRTRGTRRIVGLVMRDNVAMLDMVHRLGFTSRRIPDDDLMEVELDLQPAADDACPGHSPQDAA